MSVCTAEKLGLHIEGWMEVAELVWLFTAASYCRSVVEVGCWKGRSTFALLSGCMGQVIAVDHFKGSVDELSTYHREAREQDIFEAFIRNVGGFSNLRIMRMSSVEASRIVPEAEMVLLDGDHGFEAVSRDIDSWKAKAPRILCGHDYTHFPGVKKAVDAAFGSSVQRASGSLWVVCYDKDLMGRINAEAQKNCMTATSDLVMRISRAELLVVGGPVSHKRGEALL